MSSKKTVRRLIGVSAFACCSAILLSVTAQSARSQQVPSVSDLGDMIGGTIRFYQSLNEENEAGSAEAAAPEEAVPAQPAADPAADAGTAVRTLPDFTEEDPADTVPAAVSVIDTEPAGITDSLSLTSADPASSPVSLTSAVGNDDWMENGADGKKPDESAGQTAADGKSADEEKKESAGQTADAGEEKTEADAGKTDAGKTGGNTGGKTDAGKTGEDKSGESSGASDEKSDGKSGGKEEKSEDWMETAETADGGEELTAAASVALTLSVDNKNHTEYLHGYEDGTARPGGKITRAEACQILYNLLKSRPKERASLSDVKDDAWYAEPVRLLAACGIVDCPGDKARPDDYMTRAELVSALTRLVQSGSAGKVSFTDVPPSHPYFNAIAKAVGLGWVNGYEDGTFKPDGSITRAEAAKVVNRALSRTPDKAWIDENIKEALYSDLTADHWAYYELMEASVAHTASVEKDAEIWNPAEKPAETDKPTDTDKTEDTDKSAAADAPAAADTPDAGKPAGGEAPAGKDGEQESEHEAAQPDATGWMDEELERMLAEPLPEEVDESRLEFDGLELYALDKDGKRMKNVTLGRFLTFGKDGKYTSGDEKLDETVKDILKEITTEDMTRIEKLKAAYEYCRDHFRYRKNNYYEVGETGWEVQEALTMFVKEKGNCYNFAASFAMMARQLGYDAEAISGLVGGELQPHGWAEIVMDGERLFYDTILESSYMERGYDYDFFGQHYEKAPWPYHKH